MLQHFVWNVKFALRCDTSMLRRHPPIRSLYPCLQTARPSGNAWHLRGLARSCEATALEGTKRPNT